MRTKYSILNVSFGMFSQIILVIFGFISRKIFLMTLGIEMQGVNGTLTNIISMLSLTELGIGTAIICNLYKPIAENDTEQITSLMKLYSKVYKTIAAIVFVLGIAICPFLDLFIKEDISKSYLITIFLLFLLDAIISYLYSYKRTIIVADQRNFIVTIVRTVAQVLMYIFQIAVLLATKNFILFLIFKIIFRFIENIVLAYIADKKYPYIRDKNAKPVSLEVKSNIIDNTKALALHYIGNYLISGTDMLIITRFLGLAVSGIYSNYFTIIVTVKEVFSQFSSSITASFGNLLVDGDNKKTFDTFKKVMFIAFIISNFATVSLFCLFNPFISGFYGSQYTLELPVVFIICLNFYIETMTEPLGSLRASAGLFKPDKYLHILLAILNLIISIMLVNIIGIFGVFLGTFICHCIKEISVLPYIVSKNIFKSSIIKYWGLLFRYSLVTFVAGCATFYLCNLINISNSMILFFTKALLCVIIPNVIVILVFFRTEEFKYLLILTKSIVKKILKK